MLEESEWLNRERKHNRKNKQRIWGLMLGLDEETRRNNQNGTGSANWSNKENAACDKQIASGFF